MSDASPDDLDLPVDHLPTAERSARMEQALSLALSTVGAAGVSANLSPLGPGWSSDVDIYVSDLALAISLVSEAGWTPLEAILRHLGYSDQCTYAITDHEAILARADLSEGRAASSADRALDRARRLAHPDVRAVLEIRNLVSDGLDPTTLGQEFMAKLADEERSLGGEAFASFRTGGSPQPKQTRSKELIRRPQVRLAVSGVDGSGKSTLIAGLEEALEHCGITSTTIWTRPGMRLDRLDRIARRLRSLRNDDLIGIERLSEGQSAETIPSRKGVIGWVWLTLISVAYLADIRGQTRRASGVVIYDRHLLDALGTLEVLYQGVNSRFQRWLIRRAIPRADLGFWLDIDPDQAAARKPDDLIGADLVSQQAAAYRRKADSVPRLKRHDANHDSFATPAQVLSELNATLAQRGPSARARFFSIARRR